MKRYQRGLLELIELLMWVGGLATAGVALWGAWHGFVNWVSGPRVDKAIAAQIAKDQPVIDAANLERDRAKADAAVADQRATNAQTDTKKCVDDAKAQNKGLNEMKVRAVAAEATIRALKSAGAQREAEQQGRLAQYQKLAADKDKSAQTCEEKLATLDKFARDRARANAAAEAAKAKAAAPAPVVPK